MKAKAALGAVLLVAAAALAGGGFYAIHSLKQRRFDPETLWRIPADINVAPLKPPVRTVPRKTIAILNARRAGNRGRANRNKTTPVLG